MIYLISERKFPNGDAGGIRTLNMAKLFRAAGYDVTVLACGDHHARTGSKMDYQGIKYLNFGSRRTVFDYLFKGISLALVLKSIGLNDKDSVHIYSTNFFFVLFLWPSIPRAVSTSFDVVELFASEKFSWGALSPKYILFKLLVRFFYPKGARNIYITSEAQGQISTEDRIGAVVPSLVSEVQAYPRSLPSGQDQAINLLYSGNPQGKDNLEIMASSMGFQYDRMLQLHITGLTYSELTLLIGDNYSHLFGVNIFCYGWIDREEYEKLLTRIHFLYSVRYENVTNRYNYPTKMAELFAVGIPLVGINKAESGRILKDGGNSLLMEESTIESSVLTLQRAAKLTPTEYRELSVGALQTARQNYMIDAHKDSICELYGRS